MICQECGSPHYARNLCRKHYDVKRLAGAIEMKGVTRGLPIAEKLAFYSTIDAATGCVIWSGGRFSRGYGSLYVDGRARYAHRVAFEAANGKVPEGLYVLHKCDNPPCINVNHLFLGTTDDNSKDMMRKGRGVFLSGAQHGMAKLTAQQVIAIFSDRRPQRKIAAEYGIGQTHVSRIKRGASWTSLPR